MSLDFLEMAQPLSKFRADFPSLFQGMGNFVDAASRAYHKMLQVTFGCSCGTKTQKLVAVVSSPCYKGPTVWQSKTRAHPYKPGWLDGCGEFCVLFSQGRRAARRARLFPTEAKCDL